MPVTTLVFAALIHFFAPDVSTWLIPLAICTVLALFAVAVDLVVSRA